MSVSSTYVPPQYVGNGVTTSFSFPFQFFAAAELQVQLFDTTANANVSPQPVLNGSGTYDYTVTGVLDPNIAEYLSGANVVFNNAPLGNHRVTITRKVQRTQPIVLTATQFPPKTIEGELDRATLILQELDTTLSGSALQHPASDPAGLTIVAPPVASRASQFAGWDASGNFGAFAPPASTTAVSSAMAPVIAAASLAVARNLLNIPFSLFKAPNTTPYSVQASTDIGTLFDSSAIGGAGVFNLPDAAVAGAGAVYGFVRKINNLTLNATAAKTIQGVGQSVTSLTLSTDGDMLALESDGTNWKTIAASPNVWALLTAPGSSSTITGLKNRLMNGGAQVAQRAAPNLSTSFQYGAVDRFLVAATAGTVGAGTIAQATAAPVGRTGRALQAAGVTLTVAGTVSAKQRIESLDAATLKNQNGSVSLRVYQDTGGSINYQITLRKPTAADNYTSTTQIAQSGLISVPSATDTLITFANQALGDCSNGLEIQVDAISGPVTTKNFYFTEWQIEEGAVVTAFERRPLAQELRDCQRHYRPIRILFQGFAGASNGVTIGAPIAEMRTTPSVSGFTVNTATSCTVNSITAIDARTVQLNVTQGGVQGAYFADASANLSADL